MEYCTVCGRDTTGVAAHVCLGDYISPEYSQTFRDVRTKPEPSDAVERLAEAHWGYNLGLMSRCDVYVDETLNVMGYLYTQAFIHGYKHGKEDKGG